jgi:hypothetical protein
MLQEMPIFKYDSENQQVKQLSKLLMNPRQENVFDNMMLMKFEFTYTMKCVWSKGFTKFYTGFMQEYAGPYVEGQITLRQFHLLFEHHRAKMPNANLPKLETFPKR